MFPNIWIFPRWTHVCASFASACCKNFESCSDNCERSKQPLCSRYSAGRWYLCNCSQQRKDDLTMNAQVQFQLNSIHFLSLKAMYIHLLQILWVAIIVINMLTVFNDNSFKRTNSAESKSLSIILEEIMQDMLLLSTVYQAWDVLQLEFTFACEIPWCCVIM